MPSHNDRLLQRLTDHIEQRRSNFRVVRFRSKPGSPIPHTADPPITFGGGPQERLEALEEWFSELMAVPEEQRVKLLNPVNVPRITAAVGEMERLRKELAP